MKQLHCWFWWLNVNRSAATSAMRCAHFCCDMDCCVPHGMWHVLVLITRTNHVAYIWLQDKVVSSISELYSFMDASDATLARKVLGEGAIDQDEAAGGPEATEGAGRAAGLGGLWGGWLQEVMQALGRASWDC